MADTEKCFENAKGEVTTWCARCAVASGCRKSPDKRSKVPVTSEKEVLLTKDPGYEFVFHLVHRVYWEVVYMLGFVLLLLMLLFVLEGMILPAMPQTT